MASCGKWSFCAEGIESLFFLLRWTFPNTLIHASIGWPLTSTVPVTKQSLSHLWSPGELQFSMDINKDVTKMYYEKIFQDQPERLQNINANCDWMNLTCPSHITHPIEKKVIVILWQLSTLSCHYRNPLRSLLQLIFFIYYLKLHQRQYNKYYLGLLVLSKTIYEINKL